MPPGFRQVIHDTNERSLEPFFLGYSFNETGLRARMLVDIRPVDDYVRASRPEPRFHSEPAPAGLAYCYLQRAGFVDHTKPLEKMLQDLADSLAVQSKK